MSGAETPLNAWPCPKCGAKMEVRDSRPHAQGIRRRRKCLRCNQRLTTLEIAVAEDGRDGMPTFKLADLRKRLLTIVTDISGVEGQIAMIERLYGGHGDGA